MMDKVNDVLKSRPADSFPTVIKRQGTAEEIASLIAFLLGDESKYITGTSQIIDGGRLC
jgi:NAD(P)-dependent dehydrogenase (short-subunit alcohol dehydrogenase family)